MKKLVTIFLIAIMSMGIFTACDSNALDNKDEKKNETELEYMEVQMENVSYIIPQNWSTKDNTENPDSTIEYLYFPDDSDKRYMISFLMLKMNNTFGSRSNAEDYMDLFMETFFSNRGGYRGEYSTYDVMPVPARKGAYTYNDDILTVDVHCYLNTTDSVLIIFNWHATDKPNVYEEEYKIIIDSVEITDSDAALLIDYENIQNALNEDFSNEYGDANTKCAYSGCDNYIASKGDTNCCVKHSNKCLECKKYIDSDANYCMQCLSGNFK